MKAAFCYVTCPSKEEALDIARTLMEERLIACANVLPDMMAIYRWQGAVHEASEVVLILKTSPSLAERVSERVQALHSYECPCVAVLPVTAGNLAYLDWIAAETAGESSTLDS
ncbi:divalent-cation tolerance protein CutA [Benzoatithermus flavus]|uniref:Divalent-cation tolerance protein CutA n=1 Tax=Benzoatithermus flavus TaxID=3108223 RepID=A0ABU8XLD8_9PROT